jgi:hypothetical protein
VGRSWFSKMTLECGFRRIVKVLSLTALGAGLLFLMLLAGAGAWSVRLDKQREAQLVAEGCPADTDATRKSTPTTVTAVRPNRWRVMLPLSARLGA